MLVLTEASTQRMSNQGVAEVELSRAIEAEQQNDVLCAKLTSAAARRMPANALKISFISHDFDSPNPEIENFFNGSS